MSTTRLWLALDLRRRWRSLTVLALLVAVSSAVVLAALAGARRGESALDRLAAQTLPDTAQVLPNQPGFDWAAVRALPEVETLSEFVLGVPIAIDGDDEGKAVGFVPGDAELMRSIERPVMLAGRVPDPDRADEAMVTAGFLTKFHKKVGDTVTMRLWTPPQAKTLSADDSADVGPPKGPVLAVRIVGVGRSVWFSGVWDDTGDGVAFQPSYGLLAHYRDNVLVPGAGFTNAHVRLRGGQAAIPAFQQHLAEVSGRKDIDVWNNADRMARAQVSYTFQARSLLAFGLAALVASVVLVGQAMTRYTAASVTDLQVLRAVGMTPRQAAGAAACGPTLSAAAGAIVGVVAAAAASPWFPLGSAAGVEPAPGFDLDPLVLGLGLLLVPLAALAASGAAAWAALGRRGDRRQDRRSAVAAALARAGLPVPVVIGSRFALEAGRGRTAVPVRPALLGAVAGVLGIVGAFTFSAGVTDASATPARFGQTWQLETFIGVNSQTAAPPAVVRTVLTTTAAVPDVLAVNDSRLDVAHSGNGAAVSLITFDPVARPLDVVLTAGRMPRTADEVVLAPGSAAAVGGTVGGTVRFSAPQGERELTLVGTGFVPSSPHNDYDAGGWLLPAGYANLFGEGYKFRLVQVALRPGADPGAVSGRITAATAPLLGGQGVAFSPAAPPPPIAELRQVRILPVALGAFLLLLAVGAVGHALATAVRRRRHDVAVLRAVGMTRWQARGVVLTQASLLALVGLLFGVPLGLALGRTLWRVVADFTPLEYVPPLAFWVLALAAPTALLLANLLAAWPGQRAARLRIGHVLRAE